MAAIWVPETLGSHARTLTTAPLPSHLFVFLLFIDYENHIYVPFVETLDPFKHFYQISYPMSFLRV